MTDLNDAGIAEALERYAAARNIDRLSPEYCQLLTGFQRNPSVFAQLLDRELARIEKMETNERFIP